MVHLHKVRPENNGEEFTLISLYVSKDSKKKKNNHENLLDLLFTSVYF